MMPNTGSTAPSTVHEVFISDMEIRGFNFEL